jgi:FAD:protein FMN transferase
MMTRLWPAIVFASGVIFPGFGGRSAVVADTFVFHHENVMGTSMELRVAAGSEEQARRAEDGALREIDRLSEIFSGYDPGSEFRRWLAGPKVPTRLSPELFEVLRSCDRWRTLSGGAFEPRVDALSKLWARCAGQDRTPTPEELAAAKGLMSRPAWRLDQGAATADRLSDCPISLNAIAKGYIVERASEAAIRADPGVLGLLLNVGGDMRVCGELSRTVGIVDPGSDSETSEPIACVEVRDRAISTSGNSQRGFRIKGRWYSHKLDPGSGLPVERTACATVIAERSAEADSLATIFNVLSPEESVRLARLLPGVECLIVAIDGRITRSDGWHRYERPRPAALAFNHNVEPGLPVPGPAPEAAKPEVGRLRTWGDDNELLVKFEINRPEGDAGRYRRPYLAIWVKDKDGFPVRTLALWVQARAPGPRWFPDLKRWYRGDQSRRLVDETDLITTTARPTRPPGKYDVIWDGKDDQGKPLERGDYTLYIEAAREHGSYQSIRKPIKIQDDLFAEELKGNAEIRSAAVEYRRRPATK